MEEINVRHHRCLDIPEIVGLIVQEIDRTSGQFPRVRRVQLLALAVTSHIFTEHVLNALWRVMDSLGPLIRILPSHLWTYTTSNRRRCGVISLLHDPQSEDWERFCCYNRRIIKLPLCSRRYLHTSIHVSMVKRLFQICPGGFLPSASAVTISLHDPDQVFSIPYFSENQIPIQHLTLENHLFEDLNFEEVLGLVFRHCSTARLLKVSGMFNVIASGSFTQMIEALPELQSIFLTSPISIKHIIAQMSQLRYLRQAVFGAREMITVEAAGQLTEIPQAFVALEDLSINFANWEAASITFDNLRSNNLRRLESFIHEGPDHLSHGMVSTIHSLLRNSSLARTLTILTIDAMVSAGSDYVEYSRDDAAIQEAFAELFSLKQLRTLGLEGMCFSRFDDAWLSKAAESWPLLCSITLLGTCAGPRATLAGYIPFVKHCQNLEQLTITAEWKPFDLGTLDKDIFNEKILTVGEGRGAMVDPVGTARCLWQLFPRLRTIRHRDYYDTYDDEYDSWDELKCLVAEHGYDTYVYDDDYDSWDEL